MGNHFRYGERELAEALPRHAGTYALLLRPRLDVTLTVGRIGTFQLAAALYVYVGSALGPGGIRARVSRHLRAEKRVHWHVDAFANACSVESMCWFIGGERLECTWTQALLRLPGSSTPVPGFGSSDCSNGCPAHLVQLGSGCRCSRVAKAMGNPAASIMSLRPPWAPSGRLLPY
jgi:Uri superfamily endonuclease